ncbi:MAG: aminopeptidase [Ignavibacteriaceae bacterium]|jgi:aminopeptidase|nr:aminopeptidase [Ignavibacteriaceae bacterium]
MKTDEKMTGVAVQALKELFDISSNDRVLILTDIHCKRIAEAFRNACKEFGSHVESFEINEQNRPLKELPEMLLKMLTGSSIVLNIFKAYSEEIPFRIKWIFKVEEIKKIKMGHMPGITEDMMLRSVNVDYNKMGAVSDSLLRSLQKADKIHITTEEGTDLILGVKDRPFTGEIGVEQSEMINLPCGEVYCAPLETEAEGVVVFNASIGDIGLLKIPLKIYLEKGRITKFDSEDKNLINKINKLQNVDEDSMVIGELGIGVNPGAIITGNMLEDEKTLGTAHLAFGNNADFPGGGRNKSKIHRDYLFYRPTIEVTYTDNSKKLIARRGEFNF